MIGDSQPLQALPYSPCLFKVIGDVNATLTGGEIGEAL